MKDITVLILRIFLISSWNFVIDSSSLPMWGWFVCFHLFVFASIVLYQSSLEWCTTWLYFFTILLVWFKRYFVSMLTHTIPLRKTEQKALLVRSLVFLFNPSVLCFSNSSLSNSFLKTADKHDTDGFRECLVCLFYFSCLMYLKVILDPLAYISHW